MPYPTQGALLKRNNSSLIKSIVIFVRTHAHMHRKCIALIGDLIGYETMCVDTVRALLAHGDLAYN